MNLNTMKEFAIGGQKHRRWKPSVDEKLKCKDGRDLGMSKTTAGIKIEEEKVLEAIRK